MSGPILSYHCESKGHPTHCCKFKNAKCYRCGKIGTLANVFRSKELKSSTGQLLNLAGEATVKVEWKWLLLFGRDWITTFFGSQWMKRITNDSIVNANDNKGTGQRNSKRILEKYIKFVFLHCLRKLKDVQHFGD